MVDFVGDDDYSSDKDDNKTDRTSDSNMVDETDNSQEFNVNELFVTTRNQKLEVLVFQMILHYW